ncbi:hypothetical protein [Streptomyces sp. CMB-StM0423]|uniref:hypothetical protein n=1 Tax=Streptomyces sp. CMB-StM0423 TaxID=2059884 RepID=UPI000C713570|nr:hypothetical protein [Streptomyces sp. CMB-StM0423]AUH44772.1 hypothetical protein CXR04_08010 [Streptomyces sp. CMB-StM0423]
MSDPGAPFLEWMRESRPDAAPGVWRYGHVARPPEEPDRLSDRQLFGAAALSVLIGLIAWSFYRNGVFLFGMLDAPLDWFTPDSWWEGEGGRRDKRAASVARDLYDTLVFAGIAYACGRAGGWQELYQRYAVARGAAMEAALTGVAGFAVVLLVLSEVVPVMGAAFGILPLSWSEDWNKYLSAVFVYLVYGIVLAALLYPLSRLGKWREVLTAKWRGVPLEEDAAEKPDAEDAEDADPVAWPELRAAGLVGEAEVLGGAARGGGMNDVDLARIARAWESVRARPERLRAFADSVRRDGPAACPHPSGLRDIGRRAYRHDLVTGQVRIGAAPDDKRNPYAYRGGGIALEPALLGTGLLAVGPAGNVVSDRVTGPVAELLCLQALAGQAAVVVVGAAGAPLGDDDAYDVVIRIADPSSPHDLDLYGGTADPDEAAALLAEALLGGDEADWAHARPAVTALGQLIGAYQSAYGTFPGVAELRGLLDGDRAALAALRRDCAAVAEGTPEGGADPFAADRAGAALRELDARERQLSRPGDVGALLAGRLAVLDRPVFARFFDTRGRGRQFSMRALEHPMRVRIVLPERTHAEASRVLARLLLAQFTAAAPARSDRSLFAALVLDDAARTASPESVRAIGRLRAAHAGVVLGLRGLDDVAEPVRGPLLAAVGCRMALTGVSTWDGRHFAEAWGAEWVEAEDVTHVPDVSGGLIRKLLRWVRQVFTGTKAMSRSVTVRTVERERWSASELANTLPPGHAVLSVTTVDGERTPPVLVDLHH